MIKMTYLALLFTMIVLVVAAAGTIRSKKDAISKSIFNLFVVVVFAIVANSAFIMADIKMVAVVFHSIFLASIDWVLLFMLRYAVQYTDYDEKFGKYLNPLYVIAFVETICLLMNPIYHHVFTLETKQLDSFGVYFSATKYGVYFYIHLTFSYLLVAWIFLLLFLKTFKTARIYRRKYTSIIVCFILVVVFDAVGLSLKLPIDISLLFYCAGCLAIYFFSLYYVPKNMNEKILSTAVQMADMGVGCFDISGKCIYINNRGKQMIGHMYQFDIEENYEEMETFFREWLGNNWKEGDVERNYVKRFTFGYRQYAYDFTVQLLLDENEEPLGHFINCIDRTTEFEEYEEEHFRATHDMLTGIYNEQYFEQRVVEMLHKFPDTPYVMITSDVNDFKLINDLFGTERGDELLKMHAQMFRKYAGPNVVYGRLAEDHFGFCMPKERFRAQQFIDAMKVIETTFNNEFFRLQIKMGVYEIKDIEEPIFVMVDKCNIAISKIKEEYSSRVSVFDDRMFREEMEKNAIINEFEGALSRGEFDIFLQAQTTENGAVLGAEALARWNHPDKGMVSPAVFVPILEEAGLIYLLDSYIWELAVEQLAKWKKHGNENMYISVNISAQDQYYIDVFEHLTKLVKLYDVNPKNLKLEITESIFINEVDRHLMLLKKLQSYGFSIAIDDFGSGYSSLNILKDISADELKIDMGFLREIRDQERSQKIVSSVIGLAKDLGMTVIVEGVETREQLETLKELKCEIYQGFYFSKPIPVKLFEERYM